MAFSNRLLIRTAQAVSAIFSPFHLPVLVFCILIFFSHLSYMPWQFNLRILLMVYVFTVALPRLGIYLYRKINGWKRHHLSKRERRFVPYFLSLMSYSLLLFLMDSFKFPRFMLSVIICALVVQGVGLLVNIVIKISMHAAAAGAIIGLLMAFSLLLHFNPLPWLCLCILITGVVCTARLILRVHTLWELFAGLVVGILCGIGSLLLM